MHKYNSSELTKILFTPLVLYVGLLPSIQVYEDDGVAFVCATVFQTGQFFYDLTLRILTADGSAIGII